MSDFARLGIAVDSRQVKTATDDLGRLSVEGRKASGSADSLLRSTKRAGGEQGRFAGQTRKATRAVSGLDSALGGVIKKLALAAGAYAGVSQVSSAAEQYTKMTNSLRAMGIEAGEAAATIDLIGGISNRTRAPLEATAQLYQRISIAGRDLGASQQEVLRFTENVGLALAQTGTSSQEASGALLQLSQAMAGGTVRAEEFNSILEGAFPIAKAAAEGIDAAGGSVGRLRQLVVDGKVSSEEFFDAILSQTDQLEVAFGNTEATMSQALSVLGNNFTLFIGQLDAATGASSAVANTILLFAENLDYVAGVAAAAGIAIAASYTPAIVGAVAKTYAWVAALVTLRGALLATGIGALVVGAGLLIGGFIKLVRATGGWGAAMRVLGTVADGVFEGVSGSARAIQPALDAVWSYIAAGFLKMVRSVARTWTEFLRSVTRGAKALDFLPGMDSTILALNNAAIAAGSGVHALTAQIDGYHDAAASALEQSRLLIDAGFNKASAALATLNLVIAQHGKESAEAEDAAEAYNRALANLSKGAGKAGKSLDEAKSEAEAFAEKMKEAGDAAEELGTKKADVLISGVDGISNAWGDFVSGGVRDFNGFVDSVLDSFKGMISQMIALAARNKILIGLGFSASGSSGGTSGAVGSGGGFLGGMGNLLSGAGGLLGAFSSGAGIGASSLLSGGLGGYFGSLGAQFGTVFANGFSLTAAAGLAGMALPIIAGIALLKKAFSRKWAGGGIHGSFDADGFDGQKFDFYKGGFFRSNKYVNSAIDPELDAALDASMTGMTLQLEDMASALGLGTEALEDFTGESFSIWTNGKSQEQIQEALQAQIELTADAMAELVLGTDEFTRAVEGAFETLTRLGSSLLAVNDAMDLLGSTLFEVSLAGGDLASGLVDAFGGTEAMASSVLTYWNTFYSDAERQETTIRRLSEQFEELGLSMPGSRDGFRALVESIDLTSTAGQELYAQLLGLSGAMDQVLPQVGQFTASMSGLLDQIGGEIGAQVDAARTLAGDSKQAASLWYRTATTLRDFLSDLLNTDLTAAHSAQVHAVNASRFETAFDLARGGDVEAARDIPELAKAYLASAQASASTSLEYRRIAGAVQGQVQFLAGIAELEGANKDVLQGLYEQQIEVLTSLGRFLQLEGLTDAQVGELTEGVQALHEDWDGTVEAFQSSLGALEAAIVNAEAFSYDDLVGRLEIAVELADNAPSWLRRMVDRADTGIRTMLDFVIRRDDLTAADRWITTNALSEHVAALDFVLREDLDRGTRRLALATTADLRRDMYLNLARDLDQDTRILLLTQSSNLSRRVNVALTGQAEDTLEALSDLRSLIGTEGDGTLTFGGGVTLTADAVFSDLASATSGLTRPMSHLSDMLGELREAVDEDRQARERALQISALQLQGRDAAAAMADRSEAQALVERVLALEASTGVDLRRSGGRDAALHVSTQSGRIIYAADHVSYGAGANLGAFRSGFWADGALEDQLQAYNRRYNAHASAYEEALAQLALLGVAPSFDGGGGTGNGPRSGGLDGKGGFWAMLHPQETVIDHTKWSPPPRVATRQGGSAREAEILAELRESNRLNRELLKQQHRADFQSLKTQKESAGILRRMQVDGINVKETT